MKILHFRLPYFHIGNGYLFFTEYFSTLIVHRRSLDTFFWTFYTYSYIISTLLSWAKIWRKFHLWGTSTWCSDKNAKMFGWPSWFQYTNVFVVLLSCSILVIWVEEPVYTGLRSMWYRAPSDNNCFSYTIYPDAWHMQKGKKWKLAIFAGIIEAEWRIYASMKKT